MNEAPSQPAPDAAEQQVEALVEEFLEQFRAGQAPDRPTLVAAHPELAPAPERGRIVALKVPCAGYFSTPEEQERFLREARSSARLNHPQIVPVHEIAHEHGVPYIVSDYIEGLTLADLLSGSRPSFRETAELM